MFGSSSSNVHHQPTFPLVHRPRSVPRLLQHRSQGTISHTFMTSAVSRPFAHPKQLLTNPEIVGATRSKTRGIASIQVDKVEHRFLLAGGDDSAISVYDLSKWGSDQYQQRAGGGGKPSPPKIKTTSTSATSYHPIARSTRQRPQAMLGEEEAMCSIPNGHSAGITHVQWYPVDSGAFVSSSKDGRLLVWDTDRMTPVASSTPFPNTIPTTTTTSATYKPIATFDVSFLQPDCVAVASTHDAALTLVDVRSSAASHSLLAAHSHGIVTCAWAPHASYLVATGGMDGKVCLWDIRKPGSRACVCQLDQDVTRPAAVGSFRPDYSHLPKPNRSGTNNKTSQKRQRQTYTAPNNYQSTQGTLVTAHDGPVAALSFTHSHALVSASTDAIRLWDLRDNGHCLPRIFLPPSHATGSIVSTTNSNSHSVGVPLIVTNETTAMGECWVASGPDIYQHVLERGGRPQQVLQGHLQTIRALDYHAASQQLLSAGNDGMILAWGKRHGAQQQPHHRKRKVDRDSGW